MYLFVTVGSYKFDELIEYIDKKEFHIFLKKNGFTKLTIQIGNSKYIPKLIYNYKNKNSILLQKVKYFRYKNSINKYYDKANLILSHAGVGTTFECLRKNKKIIIVPNIKLMDNHQMEFAHFMSTSNYLESCDNLLNLKQCILTCLKTDKYETLPKPQIDKFLSDLKDLINL
ncbi:UDP-N-acetylglucosamine transferase subunit ALG13, putative [Plasmodium yoelii]|uniref:UDP-N-acetylglucosamine transferase subunit ALG13 n=2 Tax=Plasmodium yoelii TaxID=5861 RepID=A0AAE9WVL0_PLAYO|nr:UDP-N-acetylglucosamine transferase subunit ALG13, putative [Plasmodium yoelii]WBY59289.1 UDP-N-acetylglucosamine transferase subunit ALG13 [Plasmodium yoelii yoelii]CDU19441.1 glycosyltransferase, putative [Plasmodium yoelii]VTZ80076.1 UDP-N-acetylglucosamine transferase subunit ALG13, putative [Plasmodium yoelii]|eukprot:XP_022812656.1 UDP-N-acetylglucosamine transferase subunit ALG13, putative [Plasmodium yoelii]